MKRLAIFASGSGSNAENIAEYFRDSTFAEVCLILTNNPRATVLERAARLNIPAGVFDRKIFYDTKNVLERLRSESIDFIVLAGFLWLIPPYLLKAYPHRIINIHPALLPKYGGKGMYGMRVHTEVINNKEKQSGITIHYVNECYDEGSVIFQARCDVLPGDTPEDLASRVHQLEYKHFPAVIKELVSGIGN
jgi:phosphoribosylglycinamide formyltransferase 1